MISVIIPVYNSAELVEDLHAQLAPVLDDLDDEAEIVFVDDGSADDTLERLQQLGERDGRIRIVELVTNFGQHAALSAGFEHARGRYLVTMDADLQCDPADLPRLIEPLRKGYDVVSGVRVGRRDPWTRRLASWMVTRLVGGLSHVRIRDVGCPYNAITAEIADSLSAFGELRRFLKPLGVKLARRVAEVEVAHRPRPEEKRRSSYSTTGLLRLFMDFFVNTLGDVFAWVFAVSSTIAGVGLIALLALIVFAVVRPLRLEVALVAGWIALGLTLAALLVALLGLAGDYVQRIYRQSSGRPFFLVRRVHGGSEGSGAP